MSSCCNLIGTLSIGQGERGKSLEFMWQGTSLGIRVEGDAEYQFVDLGVEGVSGKEIQLQVSEGYIQWKYEDEEEWKNLISISDLKGDRGLDGKSAYDLWIENGNEGTVDDFLLSLKGKDGEKGEQGEKGLQGEKGDKGESGVYVGSKDDAPLSANIVIDDSDEGLIIEKGLVTTSIIDSTLALTTDKYQTTTMEDNTTIVLPTVDKYTEIHLFFSAESELTLILPQCKWQGDISIESGKTYEFIFTYTNEWLGGVICYG